LKSGDNKITASAEVERRLGAIIEGVGAEGWGMGLNYKHQNNLVLAYDQASTKARTVDYYTLQCIDDHVTLLHFVAKTSLVYI